MKLSRKKMTNNVKDFRYDFTNYLKERQFWLNESSKDILLRFYLFTHQFCDKTDLDLKYLPIIFKDFLEENEEIYINQFKNKICFKINNYKDKDIQNKIKYVLSILSISVQELKDENNLEITYKPYDNTNNGTIYEGIYR